MGKTYRDIAKAKIDNYYTELWKKPRTRRDSKEEHDAELELNKSLPNGYTFDDWRFCRQSDWKYEGRVRKQRILDKIHAQEINPYAYPRRYMYLDWDMEQEIEGWVSIDGGEWYLEAFNFRDGVYDCYEDWDYEPYMYPHRKKKKYTKSTRPKRKPYKYKYSYYSNKPEFMWEWKIYSPNMLESKKCIHKFEGNSVQICTKCYLVREKK